MYATQNCDDGSGHTDLNRKNKAFVSSREENEWGKNIFPYAQFYKRAKKTCFVSSNRKILWHMNKQQQQTLYDTIQEPILLYSSNNITYKLACASAATDDDKRRARNTPTKIIHKIHFNFQCRPENDDRELSATDDRNQLSHHRLWRNPNVPPFVVDRPGTWMYRNFLYRNCEKADRE